MADKTAIEWTDATWNPVHGCSKVSPGCAHCYAETLSLRYGHTTQPWLPAHAEVNVQLKPHKLNDPLKWRKPRMVFVNSMSDLFHEQVPGEYIARVFAVMAKAEQHTFQVLTKRPERMRDLLRSNEWWWTMYAPARVELGVRTATPWPLPNVWLGTSIENRWFVSRADVLRETPAAVRFISAEPLLGPLVLDDYAERPWAGAEEVDWPDGRSGPELLLDDIDWLIVGGESGPKHRPIKAEWVRDLRDAATATDTAFFFKQWGGHRPKSNGRELDGRTWDEMPQPKLAASGELLKYLELFADAAGIPKDPS